MSAINDGGPAFAQPAIYDSSRDQINQASAYGCDAGTTLRDYFAAKAMSGLVVNGDNFNVPQLAKYSYEFADAMLAARKTGGAA